MIIKPNPDVCRNCSKQENCDCLCHTTNLFDNPHEKINGIPDFDQELSASIELTEDRRWGTGRREKDWIEK